MTPIKKEQEARPAKPSDPSAAEGTGRSTGGPLTVMIVRRLGSVLSFRISPRILVTATTFFFAYIIISIVAINKYADLRFTNIEMDRMLERKQRDLEQARSGLQDYKRRIASLEQQIDRIETHRERQRRTVEEPESLPDIATGGSPEPQEGLPAGDSQGIVDIEDLIFSSEDSRATVRFKLINLAQGNDPVDGYVHLIAADSGNEPRRIWAFPPQVLRNGVPLNYRKGRRFRIRRYVPIVGKFELSPEGEAPDSLRVLIYDRSGQVIFDKEYEVGLG